MPIKWQHAAALIAAAFLIGLLISENGSKKASENTIHEKQIYRDRFDTVLSVVYVPFPALIAHAPANNSKTITLHDTLYKQACLDTLLTTDTTAIAPDTLSVCELQNIFSISLGLSPRRKEIAVPYIARDTFYSSEDTLRIQSGETRPWYQDALVIALSLFAGIIFGKL